MNTSYDRKINNIFEKIEQNSETVCEYFDNIRKPGDHFIKRVEKAIIGLGINHIDSTPFYTDLYSDYYLFIDNDDIKVIIKRYIDVEQSTTVKFRQVSADCARAILNHEERILEIVYKQSEDIKRRSLSKTLGHINKYISYPKGETTTHELFYSISDINRLDYRDRTYLRWIMQDVSGIDNEDLFWESTVEMTNDYIKKLIKTMKSLREEHEEILISPDLERIDKIIHILQDIK